MDISKAWGRLRRLYCCGAVVALLCAQLSAQDVGAEVEKAATLLQSSNYQAALASINQSLKVYPRSCPLLTLKAISFNRLTQKELSLRAFEKATVVCPTYLPALEGAAEFEYSNHSPGIIKVLRQLLVIDAGNVTGHAMLAVTLHAQGDCRGALPEFESSRSLFGSRPELAQEFAACLVEEKDYEGALKIYSELSSTHPEPAALFNVALLQWKIRSAAEALKTISPLLAEGYGPAVRLAAGIYEEEGDTPKAVETLRFAIATHPEDSDNYLDFALISFRHKSFQAGIDIINTGIQAIPDSPVLLATRGVLEVQLGENERALSDIGKAHRLNPRISIVTDALGLLQTQDHDGLKTLEFLKSETRRYPNDGFLLFLLAEQLSQTSETKDHVDLNSAITAAKNAIRLDPNNTAAHDLLAELYVRSNQLNLAMKEAAIASQQNPDDEAAIYQEILALRRSGKQEETEVLVTRLQEIRKQNIEKRHIVDRYRLQTVIKPKT